MRFCTEDDVKTSYTTERFAARNWQKHREDERYRGSDIPYWEEFAALDGKRFTRQHVVGHFTDSVAKGVISAIMWGYPNGGRPGGAWRAFSEAFRTTKFIDVIEALRPVRFPTPFEIVSRLNRIVPGVGTATTTKIAYFGRLKAKEDGWTDETDCLIYDQMVRRAIADGNDPDFADLKAVLVATRYDIGPAQQERTYGLYLRCLSAAARRHGVRPDQIELSLFNKGRDLPPRAG